MMQIDFTIQELQVLDKALQQMPYYLAAPVIDRINKQLAEQQKIIDTPIDAAPV